MPADTSPKFSPAPVREGLGVTVEMMNILGFRPTLTPHRQSFQPGQFHMYTVVGERI